MSAVPAGVSGDKADALLMALRSGLPVPPFFLVLPGALFAGMSKGQQEEFLAAREPAKVKYLVQRLQPGQRFVDELHEAVEALVEGDPDALLAVRASPADFPGATRRAVGAAEFTPRLYVRPDAVLAEAVAVWQEAFAEDALYARQAAGVPLTPPAPALLVQKMVRADVSGVAYGGDPVTGRRGVVVVAAVYGLGTSIISGESDADAYEVDRGGRIARRDIAFKQTAHGLDQGEGHGVRSRMVAASQQELAALTDAQLTEVSELTWSAGEIFARPQVIDWALEAGRLFLLQTRPMPLLHRLPDPDAPPIRWDRRTIAASYPEIATPLTYSVARWYNRGAYQELCRALGMSETDVRQRADLFDTIVGRIRGRLCLNATRIGEMLDLLPQPRWHRDQLARSLGLLEADSPRALSSGDEPLHLDTWSLGKMLTAIQARAARYEGTKAAFEQRLEAALAPGEIPLSRLRPDELIALARTLQREIVDRWDAPAVNETLAAIGYDLLEQLCRHWLGDAGGEIFHGLILDLDGLPGTEASRLLLGIARDVSHAPDLAALFAHRDFAAMDALIRQPQYASIRKSLESYIASWGDVCPRGLELESPTLRDNPIPLLDEIGRLCADRAALPEERLLPSRAASPGDIQAATRAEERANTLLADKSARRWLFAPVLALARRHLAEREEYNYARTKINDHLRRIAGELGRRFYALDAIEHPDHVFYLTFGELLGFVDGTTETADLRSLITVRRQEQEAIRREARDNRDVVATRGVVSVG